MVSTHLAFLKLELSDPLPKLWWQEQITFTRTRYYFYEYPGVLAPNVHRIILVL